MRQVQQTVQRVRIFGAEANDRYLALPFGQPALSTDANQASSLGPSGDDLERGKMSGGV
jgi:hypothetical protein